MCKDAAMIINPSLAPFLFFIPAEFLFVVVFNGQNCEVRCTILLTYDVIPSIDFVCVQLCMMSCWRQVVAHIQEGVSVLLPACGLCHCHCLPPTRRPLLSQRLARWKAAAVEHSG